MQVLYLQYDPLEAQLYQVLILLALKLNQHEWEYNSAPIARILALNREIQKEVNPFLVNAPKAVSASKKLVKDLSTKIDQKTINFTVEALADVWENPEAIEGINAFFEKRKPNWLKEK